MKIDYGRIFPDNLSQYVSLERLGELKCEAVRRRNEILKGRLNCQDILNNSAMEFAYIYAQNKDKTAVEKALLAANMVFDDEKMARILESNEFDIDLLRNYIRILNYLKEKDHGQPLSTRDAMYKNKVDIITRKLYTAARTFTGPINPCIIINKIVELLSFRPELILDKKEITFKKLYNYLTTEFHKIDNLRYVYYTVEHENEKEIIRCNFIVYGNNVEPSDLVKIASVIEVMKNEFKNKNINITFTVSSVKNFNESDDVSYLYYKNSAKIKIRRA